MAEDEGKTGEGGQGTDQGAQGTQGQDTQGQGAAGTAGQGTEERHTLVVDGVEKTFTLDELKTMATKAGGADSVFQKAATMRKSAEDALALQDLIQRAQTDNDAYRELARQMGHSEEDIEATLKFAAAQAGTSDGSGGSGTAGDGKTTPPPPALTAQQEADIEMGRQAALNQERERLFGEMKNALDRDPILGQDKVKDAGVREELLVMVKAAVTSAVAQGTAYGPDLLSSVVQQMRTSAKRLGILDEKKGPPAVDPVAALAKEGVGLGPSDSPAVQAVREGKLPLRVPVTDPKYADTFATRALLSQQQRMQEASGG